MSGVTTILRRRIVRPGGNPEVPVVEHGHAVEKDLEDEDGDGGRSEGSHHSHFDQQGDHDFQRVKTERRGEIEVHIRVVHPVEPPEKMDPMKQDVLGVDDHIKHQKA